MTWVTTELKDHLGIKKHEREVANENQEDIRIQTTKSTEHENI